MAAPIAPSPPAPSDAPPPEGPGETQARTGPPSWEEQVEQVFGGTEGMGDGEADESQPGIEAAPAATTPSQPAAAVAPEAPAADPLVALLQELRSDQAAMRAELTALREGREPAPGAKPQPSPTPTPSAPAPPDPAVLKARQDRMLRDPHYAQAVGVLGSDVPEHVALNARHLLEGRAYYASRTEDPTEGAKARAALERLDAQLESLRETAALHQRLAAQAKTEQPAAQPTSVPLAQRLTYADRLVEGLRNNAPAIADLAGLTEGEVVRIAAETEGADEGAWFDAFFERAYALAQTRRTQAALAPAAPKPAPGAKPAPKPRPGNSVLRNPAPVGQGSTSPTATERMPWPKDRPPTDAELEDRIFARN